MVNDVLVDVNLAESSAPVTPKNVDHGPGGDSDQEEYTVARADLPSPLVAISKWNKALLGAGTMVAKECASWLFSECVTIYSNTH